MKLSVILLFSFLFVGNSAIDKSGFYTVFESESKTKIEDELAELNKLSASTLKDAYIGALTMKKAQFMKTPKEKATIFKAGKESLESAIASSTSNGEYRFLRLVIQENSPKILKYNSDIEEDVAIIVSKYKELDPIVRKFIKKYAEKSEHLKPEKLK